MQWFLWRWLLVNFSLFRLLSTFATSTTPSASRRWNRGFFQLVDLHACAYSQKTAYMLSEILPPDDKSCRVLVSEVSGIAFHLAETPQRPRALFLSYACCYQISTSGSLSTTKWHTNSYHLRRGDRQGSVRGDACRYRLREYWLMVRACLINPF